MNLRRLPLILLVGTILLAGCTPAPLPAVIEPTATLDLGPIQTAAVQTYQAEATRNAALLPTATEAPASVPPTSTQAPAPTLQATVSIPVSGSSGPTITASIDTNCRVGPGPGYEVVGALRVGQTSSVAGRLRDGGWWYIRNITHEEPKYCWVWAQTTVVTGSTEALPYVEPPLLPEQQNPVLTLGLSVSPSTFATCPATMLVSGSVTSDRATTLKIQVSVNSGEVLYYDILNFTDDGTKTLSVPYSINQDEGGYFILTVTSPVSASATSNAYSVNCP